MLTRSLASTCPSSDLNANLTSVHLISPNLTRPHSISFNLVSSRPCVGSNYFHVLYEKEDFIKLDADAVDGIKSWRFTAGGVTSRDIGTVGHGGGEG